MELLISYNHKRENSESDPLQKDSDDSSFTLLTPETKFDIEQFYTAIREHSEELPLIAGDSNFEQGEKQHYLLDASTGNTVTIHNKLYQITPASRYHAAIVQPTDPKF
ncbi:hypothetical protein ACTXT7_015808 [Hymenolepis weldensis]